MRPSLAIALGLALVAASAAAPAASAQTASGTETIQCGDDGSTVDVETAVGVFESSTDRIPGAIRPALASNTTHLRIEGADPVNYTVRTDDDFAVTSFESGAPESPDTVVETTDETACEIVGAEDPVDATLSAYHDDEIDVRSTSTMKNAAISVAKVVVDAADAVRGLLS